MSKETELERIIPNEIILIGKPRDGKNDFLIETVKDGAPIPENEILKAVLAKYKFTRDTAPNAAAQEAGFLTGKFYQTQMADPGGEIITLANGMKVRRSRKTTDPGYANIFASSQAILFEEIKEELLHLNSVGFPDRIGLVGGDPSNGKIKLKEFALMGFWDEFPLGFTYFIHYRDKDGKLVPFMSSKKQDDGSFKKEKSFTNTGRHFVFEDQVHNLEGLRETMRNQVIRWKKTDSTDNTTPEKGVAPTPAPPAEKPAIDSEP